MNSASLHFFQCVENVIRLEPLDSSVCKTGRKLCSAGRHDNCRSLARSSREPTQCAQPRVPVEHNASWLGDRWRIHSSSKQWIIGDRSCNAHCDSIIDCTEPLHFGASLCTGEPPSRSFCVRDCSIE